MNKLEQWDEKFVSTALDKHQRDRKLRRLRSVRIWLSFLLTANIILLSLSILGVQAGGEILYDRVLLLFLTLLILYRTESDIRIMKIAEALRREGGASEDSKRQI